MIFFERHPQCAFSIIRSALILLLWLGWSIASAEGIALRELRIQINPEMDAYVLQADAAIDLDARLEEAIGRGLPLYFVLEAEVTRARWYWFDERLVELSQSYRLSFNALTRQYRVAIGGLQLRFGTLSEALGFITRIRNLKIADRNQLQNGTNYNVSARLRLDINQLPKPFQVNALTAREWNLNSGWQRFNYLPAELKAAASEPKAIEPKAQDGKLPDMKSPDTKALEARPVEPKV